MRAYTGNGTAGEVAEAQPSVSNDIRHAESPAQLTSRPSAASPLPSEGDGSSEDEGYASSSESVRSNPYAHLMYCVLQPSTLNLFSRSHNFLHIFSLQDQDYAAVMARFKDILESEPAVSPVSRPSRLSRPPRLSSFDLAGVAELISSGKARRIVCMVGAGISVNAGIPDFRSPKTGLYSRLQDYGLPHPTAVFEIDFFRRNPQPFFLLAKELFPGTYAPTATHHFLKLLHDKSLLLRCYTQNIDSLERIAGLPTKSVVAAHGNFDSARCIDCKASHEVEFVREAVFAQEPCFCADGRPGCNGLVKPDIVFFGESLPRRFWSSMEVDLPQADLLIVMGTSLVVQPFASLIDRVKDDTPRLLINRERVGETDPVLRQMGYKKGFNFGNGNFRDALFEGDCDEGIWTLCKLLGWEDELKQLVDGWAPPEGVTPAKTTEKPTKEVEVA